MGIGYINCKLLFYGWLYCPAKLENQALRA